VYYLQAVATRWVAIRPLGGYSLIGP